MVITLIICLPITALVVGFLVLKSVNLGLRWQLNIKDNKEPELHNPIAETVKEHKQQKQAEISKSLFDEWTNGKED